MLTHSTGEHGREAGEEKGKGRTGGGGEEERREEEIRKEKEEEEREATVALVPFKEKALGDDGQGF